MHYRAYLIIWLTMYDILKMLTRIEETFCNKHSPIAVTGTYVFRKHGPSPSG